MTWQTGDEGVYGLCRRRQGFSYESRANAFSTNVRSLLYKKFCRSHLLSAPGVPPSAAGPLGSVFNVEFSPDDAYVVAVLAGSAFEIYDPRLRKRVHSRLNAHEDCVNCVTFVSDVQFATCSDDSDIRLWDARNFTTCLGVLRGSRNCVKNIEYDRKSGLLFSISFFEGVKYWDLRNIDRYAVADSTTNSVQTLPDPIRMRIAPDGSKMFISSRKNTCMVINEFDGARLADVRAHITNLVTKNLIVSGQLEALPSNKPTIHILCGKRGVRKERAVLSAAFHPGSDLIAMRYTDSNSIRIGDPIIQEITTLYDLRPEPYSPYVMPEQAQEKYLKYTDDVSPRDTDELIKEICFSGDGRVLASPHKNGVRLFAVDPLCTSADVFYDKRYSSTYKDYNCPDLEKLSSSPAIHSSSVLTCKFAHTDFILASGSLNGTVAFTSPQI